MSEALCVIVPLEPNGLPGPAVIVNGDTVEIESVEVTLCEVQVAP
jgi:hypothetical protein